MPRDIDPFAGRPARPPAPAQPPAAQPPAARPTSTTTVQMQGTPPLPTGQPLTLTVPFDKLTPQERAALEKSGAFKTGDAVPTAVGPVLREALAEAQRQADAPPDLSGVTPVGRVNTVDLDSLPAEEQRRFRQVLLDLKNAPPPPAAAPPSGIPGVEDARRVAERAAAYQPPPEATPAPEAGGAPHPANCPHCGWDLGMADDTEPTEVDKLGFLHSLLGQKSFTRDERVFGGQVVLTFRTLTARELEVIFKQAFRNSEKGLVPREGDYWELVNRYRLALQLQGLHGPGGVFHDLADGYSRSTNPHATGVWVTETREGTLAPGETGLPVILDYVTDRVLVTESLFRVVHNACHRFNRLAARLEALADNPDFWAPGSPR